MPRPAPLHDRPPLAPPRLAGFEPISPICHAPFSLYIAHFILEVRSSSASHTFSSQAAESRQLAAVLMRRRLGGHWRKLDVGVQGQMKVALLERLTNEPVSIVRSSTADLVCVIARQVCVCACACVCGVQ